MAANGVQEQRVSKAKDLIAQQNYDDALLVLATVVREEPDRLDEAQELIREIYRLREKYNDQYEQLIKLLYVDKDEATALKVIAQLEKTDKNPNSRTQEDIRQAKRTARLIANNKRYNDIMTRALAALNRRDYGQAVNIYLEGQDLARDMFLESDFGNVFNSQVDRTWDDLKAASALFVKAEAIVKALPAQAVSLLGETQPSPNLEAALSTMRDLAAWRQRTWSDGRFFKAQNDFLTKNGRQSDFFLDYSNRFAVGPPNSTNREGILGALDRMWTEVLEPWTAQIRTGVETRYTQAKAAFDKGDWAAAAPAFEGLRIRSRQGLDVVALWNRSSGIDSTGVLDPTYRARLTDVLPLQVWLDHRLSLALAGAAAAKTLPRNTALAATAAGDRAALEAARAEVKGYKDTYAANALLATNWAEQSRQLVLGGWTVTDNAAFGTAWAAAWNGHRQTSLALEADLVDRRGTLDYTGLDGRFQALQATLTSSRDQIEGKVKYPLQASQQLEALKPLQDTLGQDIGGFIRLYDGESADVKTPAVVRWPVRGRDLLARLTTAQAQQVQLFATARANYEQSQQLKKQGSDLLPGVDTAMNAENFTQARAVINQASTRWSQSLTMQEDAAFRTEADAQIKALFDKVLKAENEVVVRDVRKLITQGSQAYLAQQFDQAGQILGRARTRWAVTNTEPNSEVEYWLGLVGYATSVTSGRELSPIDPLYNEVQQLLSFARQDLEKGQKAVAAGDKEGGIATMKEGRDVLAKILLPFPLNQAARLLNLEILKASDPENFPTLFQQNYEAAVKKITTNPAEAYSDLQDLKELQPDYTGLAASIKKVRLALGLDRPPVDTAAQDKAKTLIDQAERLFAGGKDAQLTQASGLVTQALDLVPTYARAQDLKDKIALKLNAPPPIITPTMQAVLTEITTLVQNQRINEAWSRMNEFLAAYPGVDKNQQVKEQVRRIKALLG